MLQQSAQNLNPRQGRSSHLRRNSNSRHDKKALKKEVEQLLESAGLQCGFTGGNKLFSSKRVSDYDGRGVEPQRDLSQFSHDVLRQWQDQTTTPKSVFRVKVKDKDRQNAKTSSISTKLQPSSYSRVQPRAAEPRVGSAKIAKKNRSSSKKKSHSSREIFKKNLPSNYSIENGRPSLTMDTQPNLMQSAFSPSDTENLDFEPIFSPKDAN